jgi:hypothetical protein
MLGFMLLSFPSLDFPLLGFVFLGFGLLGFVSLDGGFLCMHLEIIRKKQYIIMATKRSRSTPIHDPDIVPSGQ